MKKTLTNIAATKSLMDVAFQEVKDELSKALGRTPKQLERIKDTIDAHYKRTATAMLLMRMRTHGLIFHIHAEATRTKQAQQSNHMRRV